MAAKQKIRSKNKYSASVNIHHFSVNPNQGHDRDELAQILVFKRNNDKRRSVPRNNFTKMRPDPLKNRRDCATLNRMNNKISDEENDRHLEELEIKP